MLCVLFKTCNSVVTKKIQVPKLSYSGHNSSSPQFSDLRRMVNVKEGMDLNDLPTARGGNVGRGSEKITVKRALCSTGLTNAEHTAREHHHRSRAST